MSPLWILACNTAREALRQKFVLATLLCSFGLLLSSLFFQQFNFGDGELKFLRDFGFGAMSFFGALLCVFAAGQLFFSDLEKRTVHLILAHPVSRWTFVLGKAMGVAWVVTGYLFAIALTLWGILYWRHGAVGAGTPVVWTDLIIFAYLQSLRALVLIAVAILVGSYARSPLLTSIITLVLWVVFQIQHLAQDTWEQATTTWARLAAGLLRFGMPNFQYFSLGDQLVLREPGYFNWWALGGVTAYAMGFAALYLGAAMVIFSRREI